ncbi:MAG: hypothetical protein IPM79_13615 [Polyangiaceae bacterium]|nr:hypothetical protein [Polyangiaceae bacterium]
MARAFRSLTLALALGSLAFGLGCAATTPAESFSSQASCCQRDDRTIAELIELAREGDPSAAGALRARGPAAHEALLARLDAAVGADRAPLAAALDRVAAQRDADVSRLYWYTDLEEAKRAAAGRGKPILSLRLLGRLDDELSCANSRFFRTTLYPNERVSKALRERFVLHWSSEREAPLVTIDFRDGRKVQRTVTGNSLHYVLDPQGRVLDAIPGLYTPEAFLLALADAEGLYAKTSAGPPGAFEGTVRAHHRARAESLEARWLEELARAGLGGIPAPVPVRAPDPALPPPAAVAMPLAAPKAMVEMPVIRATKLGAVPARLEGAAAAPAKIDDAFEVLAARAQPPAIDATSRALIARKRPMSWTDPAGPRALSAGELDRLIESFERLMKLDAVKNEFRFHATIHAWLADETLELGALNTKVYTELFLTPASDPWLGLVPPEAYTAIDGDGLVE